MICMPATGSVFPLRKPAGSRPSRNSLDSQKPPLRLARDEAVRAPGLRGDQIGFMSGFESGVILLQEPLQFVPIEPAPVEPPAGEKFEFAVGEHRHPND